MGNNFDTFRKVLCGFSEVVINYKKNKLQGQVKIFQYALMQSLVLKGCGMKDSDIIT